jgi:cellulose synthase/poly-beta-1,6-N-acetylglucosamine synthase-like glycosyltransferase
MALKIIFYVLIFALFYIYFGYPVLLFLISLIRKKKKYLINEAYLPNVSLVIAAYNEEVVIEEKINNSLELDYPKDKLEIIVFSDTSSDRTDEIVKEYEKEGIKLVRIEGRKGKTVCQNEVIKLTKGEIIVFSDANSIYEPIAIKRIVRNFYDKEVGCVIGELKYREFFQREDINVVIGENVYWSYEQILKRLESKVSSLVGGNGAIYGLRKNIYIPLDKTMISDFVEPLKIFKKSYRIVYEPEAIAWEKITDNARKDFRRRVRIVTRSAYSLFKDKSLRELLNPFRYSIFAIQLLSHKVLRWFSGALLFLVILLNILLLGEGLIYNLIMSAQGVFYIFAIWGFMGERLANKKTAKVPYVIYYFCLSCVAMLYGVINAFMGKKMVTWETTR